MAALHRAQGARRRPTSGHRLRRAPWRYCSGLGPAGRTRSPTRRLLVGQFAVPLPSTGGSSLALLVADATGLPGLGRIVEELREGDVAQAIIEVETEEDRQEFVTRGDVTYTWLVGSGLGKAPSALFEAVEKIEFPESESADVYAWVACESATSRRIRKHLREVRGIARDKHNVVGYWREGADGHVSGMNSEEVTVGA